MQVLHLQLDIDISGQKNFTVFTLSRCGKQIRLAKVFRDFINRRVRKVIVVVSDGFSGIYDAVETAFLCICFIQNTGSAIPILMRDCKNIIQKPDNKDFVKEKNCEKHRR